MELLRPSSADEAVAALGNGSTALAGGTDLVPLLRDGLVRADTLVHLADAVPRGIRLVPRPVPGTVTEPSRLGDEPATPPRDPASEGGSQVPGPGQAGVRHREGSVTRIGAGTTLAELEVDPQIPAALREACRLSASPQLRNAGTIGGNLLQATRCWYWRLRFGCWLQGGDRCHAKEGVHREHAIFGNERCASAHPSDPAAALLALGATARTTRRELPLGELYRLPTDDDRDVTTLAADELILELDVPAPEASTYLKAMDRQRWAFALVGVAAARTPAGTRIALAGVAPVPWLLPDAAALDAARPLPQTRYKVDLARALVRRALETLG